MEPQRAKNWQYKHCCLYAWESPFLELDYKCNDKPIRYKVPLITKTSNIGKGKVWFFKCPHTGKLCRKPYLADIYFFHCSAFRGCMHEKQTYSKQAREQFRQWDKLFTSEGLYEQICSKYFKTHYADRPTKCYQKLFRKLSKAGIASESTLLSVLIKRK